jgi:transposase
MFLRENKIRKEDQMTAETKIAQNRLTLLQLAEQIQNISEACRRRGVSRSQFYEYKRAFQEHGFEGLKDLPPIPKSCPHETSAETKEKILSLSIARFTSRISFVWKASR